VYCSPAASTQKKAPNCAPVSCVAASVNVRTIAPTSSPEATVEPILFSALSARAYSRIASCARWCSVTSLKLHMRPISRPSMRWRFDRRSMMRPSTISRMSGSGSLVAPMDSARAMNVAGSRNWQLAKRMTSSWRRDASISSLRLNIRAYWLLKSRMSPAGSVTSTASVDASSVARRTATDSCSFLPSVTLRSGRTPSVARLQSPCCSSGLS
jgi:hypothetical protein